MAAPASPAILDVPTTPATGPRIVAVNHVGISVSDLPRAVAFWTEALGAHHHGGWSWPVGTAPADESLATRDTAAEVVLLRTDTAFMELFAFAAPTPGTRACDAPGVRRLTWAVDDVDAARGRALALGGTAGPTATQLYCPDGTAITLVEAPVGARGLVGVEVAVADATQLCLPPVPGPVVFEVHSGADRAPSQPVDLGANHVCFDVAEIGELRASLAGVVWHHEVTESSGGIAAVSYGTTADGLLIELLESRTDQAFLARCRLNHP